MKLFIEIEMENDAFHDECGEIGRLLNQLASVAYLENMKSYHGKGDQILRDSNDEVCGKWYVLETFDPKWHD